MPDVVKERLETYEKETLPLVDFYRKKGILIEVSAEGEVGIVHERVLAAIEEYFKKRES